MPQKQNSGEPWTVKDAAELGRVRTSIGLLILRLERHRTLRTKETCLDLMAARLATNQMLIDFLYTEAGYIGSHVKGIDTRLINRINSFHKEVFKKSARK